jgi:hypothetical protein
MFEIDDVFSRRLVLPHSAAENIEILNRSIADHLYLALRNQPSMSELVGVTAENLAKFDAAGPVKRALLSSPFLLVEPVLCTERDWKALIENKRTDTIEKLMDSLPPRNEVTGLTIYFQNKTYISLIKDLLNSTILAAPICGLSLEVADYLMSVPRYALERALSDTKYPLFRWRFNNASFWFDVERGCLDADGIGHYLMMTSSIRADALPSAEKEPSQTYSRLENETYADLYLRLGARTSTVKSLFNVTSFTSRPTFKRYHGQPSPVGKIPASVSWTVINSRNRLQSSVFVWLYRTALAVSKSVADAHVASVTLCRQHFGDNFALSFDRAFNLAKTMAADSTAAVAACRNCATPYVIANTQTNVELPHLFTCPSCLGTLYGGRGSGQKRAAAERADAN